MDLTETLLAIPTSRDPAFFDRPSGPWTEQSLQDFLDAHKLAYTVSGQKYKLATCPFCGDPEGNPACWLNDGFAHFKCSRANHCADKTFATLQARVSRKKLPRISALDLPAKFPRRRPQVVKGLLRRGDVANIIGGPKARKSFYVMQLALCVASGTRFIGFEVVQGRVLLIDNELRGDDLSLRIQEMARAMGLDWHKTAANIEIMPLRGTMADIYAVRDDLDGDDDFSLVVFDALYKFLPAGTEENANNQMTQVYLTLDQIAERHNVGAVVVHHTSKGNQSGKSVTDMGAGAGAQ